MKPLLVLYATREGQTRKIAEHLGAAARARGLSVDVLKVTDVANPNNLPGGFSLDMYSAAILGASVHLGKHEKEMADFIKTHRAELETMRTVFLSVSLAEAGAEDAHASPEQRAKSSADVERVIHDFLAETGWHPSKIQAVAGALLYTKYNLLLRLVMKWIARRAGGDTDTAHDHEYTDWAALDHLLDELVMKELVVEEPAANKPAPEFHAG